MVVFLVGITIRHVVLFFFSFDIIMYFSSTVSFPAIAAADRGALLRVADFISA